jgi:hypothetical protein
MLNPMLDPIFILLGLNRQFVASMKPETNPQK